MCKPTVHASAQLAAVALLLSLSCSAAFAQRSAPGAARSEVSTRAEAAFQSALILFDKGDNTAGRARLQEAISLWISNNETVKAAETVLQAGDLYARDRAFQGALNYYQQAIEIRPLPGTVRAKTFNAIALVYARLFLNDLSKRYYNKALEAASKANDVRSEKDALVGLADFYIHQREWDRASGCVTQAMRAMKRGRLKADPDLLRLKGQIDKAQGLVEKARQALSDALRIYREANDVAGQVKTLVELSALSLLVSQKQAALELAEQAFALAEKKMWDAVNKVDVANKVAAATDAATDAANKATTAADTVIQAEIRNAWDVEWRAWLSRAHAESASGSANLAIRSYKQAIGYFEGLWISTYVGIESSAISSREEIQAAYGELVDLLMGAGEVETAISYAESCKARMLLNLTTTRKTPITGSVEQEAALAELSRSIASLRMELLNAVSSVEQARLRKAIDEKESKQLEILSQIEMDHYKDRLTGKRTTIEQLEKKSAQEPWALAEFFLGEDRSFVWLFTHGKIIHTVLPPRQKIEQAVKSYLATLSTPPSQMHLETNLPRINESGKALFDMLLGKLAETIEPGQPLIIVPDGLLYYLPFETLISQGRYLIETHVISYVPSFRVLESLQRRESGSEQVQDRMELLALGDPSFEPEPKSANRKHLAMRTSEQLPQIRAARGYHFSPLPRTHDEVEYVASLFPADRCKVFLGDASTEAAIKREPLRRYRRLHFATHGLIDETSPQHSAVVLTPGSPDEDGFLEVGEISRLDLDCDLVVVSACSTGRGGLLSGEGIVGLSRAFLLAGARSTVVSLWNVSDISTGYLMKNFYQHLASGSSNAEALRQAKLEMLRSGKETRHPYYWAPFVVVGKP